jgi:hypothetical protein
MVKIMYRLTIVTSTQNISGHSSTRTPYQLKTFYNEQIFDFDGLKGRLSSSSYMPTKDDEGYDAMITHLQALFDKYQQNGSHHHSIRYQCVCGHRKACLNS